MKYILPLLTSAMFLAVGCATRTEQPVAVAVPSPPAYIARHADVLDSVASDVQILDVRMVRNTEHLFAQALLQNLRSSDCSLRYRYTWYNASGIEIRAAASPWRDIKLAPQERREISSAAPTPECVDFHLSLSR